MKAMRERQAADRKAKIEEHDAAMQAIKIAEQKADDIAEDLEAMMVRYEEEISAAMQAFETEVAARRLYHEAPNDVFELIFYPLSDGDGRGGLNDLRLVSKRCMRVVESMTTRLTGVGAVNTLPTFALKRCKRIEHIRTGGFNGRLRSLEGCPDGLKSLYIRYGRSLDNLKPLSACKGLENLQIWSANFIIDLSPLSASKRLTKLTLRQSKVTDLTPLSSMLLEELDLQAASIKDISPLSQCKKLKNINIRFNQSVKDLSPLCHCPELGKLDISALSLIKDLSFFEKGFSNLRALDIRWMSVEDLSSLTTLMNLDELNCCFIPPTTSLLPLARCYKLKKLMCLRQTGLDDLRERKPGIVFTFC